MLIHVVIVRILHPDPERLGRLAMTLVIPSKVRSNGQSDPEDSSGDGLGVGINLHQKNFLRSSLDIVVSVDVVNQMSIVQFFYRPILEVFQG